MNFEPTKVGLVTVLDDKGREVSKPVIGVFCFIKGRPWIVSNIGPIHFKDLTAAPHSFEIRDENGTRVGGGSFQTSGGEWDASCVVCIPTGNLTAEIGC